MMPLVLGRARRVLTRTISRFSGEVSFSQEGEDRILTRMLEGAPPGFYVDVGAHHPTRFSNTALLYREGWCGINVDARPGTRELFARHRPRDVTIETGVAATAGMLEYFVFNDQALNTFSRARAELLVATTPYRVLRTITVPVLTLAELLDRHLPPNQSVDLLLVDVEGFDLDVLTSNDWSRYRPRLILVEDLDFRTLDSSAEAATVRYLRPLGYAPIAKTVNTVFFELSGGR